MFQLPKCCHYSGFSPTSVPKRIKCSALLAIVSSTLRKETKTDMPLLGVLSPPMADANKIKIWVFT